MRRNDFKVWAKVLVRWGDMDSFGHVNNARYFTYCESARIRYFEAIRLEEFQGDTAHGPAVVSATCNFRRQVRYPAELAVGARATHVGRSSFTLSYALYLGDDDQPVADGSSVVVWVDYARGGSIPLPDPLRARLRAFDGIDHPG